MKQWLGNMIRSDSTLLLTSGSNFVTRGRRTTANLGNSLRVVSLGVITMLLSGCGYQLVGLNSDDNDIERELALVESLQANNALIEAADNAGIAVVDDASLILTDAQCQQFNISESDEQKTVNMICEITYSTVAGTTKTRSHETIARFDTTNQEREDSDRRESETDSYLDILRDIVRRP